MSFRAHLLESGGDGSLLRLSHCLPGWWPSGRHRHSGTHTRHRDADHRVAEQSPDQTATLATGYVGISRRPSSASHAKLGLPADVSLTAQTAAQSPIIFISATAPDEATAQRAAGDGAAEVLREVNANLQAGRDNLIDQMQRAVDADITPGRPGPAKIDMQDRINAVTGPNRRPADTAIGRGVTAKSSGTKRTIAVALVGGLVFGGLWLRSLGATWRRLPSPGRS